MAAMRPLLVLSAAAALAEAVINLLVPGGPFGSQHGVSSIFITSPVTLLCKSWSLYSWMPWQCRCEGKKKDFSKAYTPPPPVQNGFPVLFWGLGHCFSMLFDSRAADDTMSTLTWTFMQFLHSFWPSFSAEVMNAKWRRLRQHQTAEATRKSNFQGYAISFTFLNFGFQ